MGSLSILLSNGENVAQKCEMKVDIISTDNFGCNITYQMQLKINDNVAQYEIIDYTRSSIICKIYGVQLETEYPMWVEYLLMSYIFYELNNEKMAFFIAFAALDQFIELLYTRLPILYRDVYFENEENISEDDATILEEKRRIYTNINRRLVDEKLHDILKERFDDATIYNIPYSALKIHEKTRNKIAHCEHVDVVDQYLDLLLNILKIMYLAGMGEDLIKILQEK